MRQLVAVSRDLPLVFAVHPRTRKKLEEFGLMEALAGIGTLTRTLSDLSRPGGRGERITLTEPLGYIQFMNLVCGARAVITDSGGVQEESTYLGIPCLTLRENTERPITVTEGSNRLVRPERLYEQVAEVLGVSYRMVRREWKLARAWLAHELRA